MQGQGRYVGDVAAGTHALHMAVLRSPHAHAELVMLDVRTAATMPGVAAVLTAVDLEGVGDLPCDWVPPGMRAVARHPVLARDRVRYVGQPVAVVAAHTLAEALDAVEAITADYTPLGAAVGLEAALGAGAPLLHDEAPGNRAFVFRQQAGDFDSAARDAEIVARQRILNNRVAPVPMEGRAVLSAYDPASGKLTHRTSSQLPHVHQRALAIALGLPQHRLRLIAPDVGGGFGAKLSFYAEDVLAAFLSMRLGQAVRWTESRGEGFLSSTHGRGHVADIELAARRDGTVLALRACIRADLGAYALGMGPGVPAINCGLSVTGAYDIPVVDVLVTGAYTNTAPVGPYRGAGHPEATFLIEQAMDGLARALTLDPVALRRLNFVPAAAFPYKAATGLTYDSGNYVVNLDAALALADIDALRRAQAAARIEGRYLGVGVATYVELSGAGPSSVLGAIGLERGGYESARVVIHPDGTATIFSGAHSHGQGHATSLAQIAADALGVPPEQVKVIQGDTESVPFGTGTFNSRSMAVGGSAVHLACKAIADKAAAIAAHLAGDGGVTPTLAEVARAAHLGHRLPAGMAPGLDETRFFNPVGMPASSGTHVAFVEVNAETGSVSLLRHVVVDDCGRVINPLLAAGQVHGGAAQGIGQALSEAVVYDDEGQLVTGSLSDYAVPRASDLPSFATAHTVSPSPLNPLGVKGIGEGAAIGAPPAVVSAVLDALAPFGVTDLAMPLTAEKIWRAISGAKDE